MRLLDRDFRFLGPKLSGGPDVGYVPLEFGRRQPFQPIFVFGEPPLEKLDALFADPRLVIEIDVPRCTDGGTIVIFVQGHHADDDPTAFVDFHRWA